MSFNLMWAVCVQRVNLSESRFQTQSPAFDKRFLLSGRVAAAQPPSRQRILTQLVLLAQNKWSEREPQQMVTQRKLL